MPPIYISPPHISSIISLCPNVPVCSHEWLKKTNASYLDTFDLVDFVFDPNGDEGIHAQVRRLSDNKVFILTLDYLKVKPRKSKNFELIDDYGVWFVNYR